MAKSMRAVTKTISVTKEVPKVSKLRHAADIAVSEMLGIPRGGIPEWLTDQVTFPYADIFQGGPVGFDERAIDRQ